MTDNNENEDLNNIDLENGEAPPKPPNFTAGLAEAWRTKPLFKLIVVVIAVGAVVAVASSFLTPEKEASSMARVMTPPDIKSAPGGSVSPYMKAQTDLANKQRTEGALKNGGSALPTPQGRVADLGDLEKKNDPLSELKTETEHLKQELAAVQQVQKQPTAPAPQPQPVQQRAPEADALAQAMSKQMSALSEKWRQRGGTKLVPVSAGTASGGSQPVNANGQPVDAYGNPTTNNVPPPKVIVSAGTVSYAQLLTEANSDVPGPILAQIVSGPLAGARAVGSFQVKNDYLVMIFNNANLKKVDYPINAVALDPDTTLGGMATEVDNRYFVRVVLPAAAAFLEGVGTTLGQPPSTTTTTTSGTITSQGEVGIKTGMYEGLGKAATTAGQFFQNEGNNTKALVRVASGTPIGMFFTLSVKEPVTANQNNTNNQYNGQYNSQYPRASNAPGSYQGTTVAGYGGQPTADASANTAGGYGSAPYGSGQTAPYGSGPYGTNTNMNVGSGYNTAAPAINTTTPSYMSTGTSR